MDSAQNDLQEVLQLCRAFQQAIIDGIKDDDDDEPSFTEVCEDSPPDLLEDIEDTEAAMMRAVFSQSPNAHEAFAKQAIRLSELIIESFQYAQMSDARIAEYLPSDACNEEMARKLEALNARRMATLCHHI